MLHVRAWLLLAALAIVFSVVFALTFEERRLNPAPADLVLLANGDGIDTEVIGVHEGGILSMALSPDGKTLVTSGIKKSTSVWDLQAKKKLQTWDDGKYQKKVEFSSDGKWLFACGGGSPIDVRSTTSWKIERELKGHGREFVVGLAVSSDSAMLYSADFDKIKAWSLSNWKNQTTFDGPSRTRAIRLSRDDKILFAVGAEELWAIDVKTGKRLRSVKAHEYKSGLGIDALAVSPKDPIIATGGIDAKVILWKLETFDKIRVLEGPEESSHVAVFTSDGKHVLSCGGRSSQQPGDLCVWETETGRLIQRKTATDGGPLNSLVISSIGPCVIVAGYGGEIVAYKLETLLTRSPKKE